MIIARIVSMQFIAIAFVAFVGIAAVISASSAAAQYPVATAPPYNGANCVTPTDVFFADEVWTKVGAIFCLKCHKLGGDAEESKFVLRDPQRSQGDEHAEAMRTNRDAFAQMASLQEGDQARLLLKVVGKLEHGGEEVLKPDEAGYSVLADFVRRVNAPLAGATAEDKNAPPFFDGVVMLDDRKLLRRVTLSLAGRLPTETELAAVASQGLTGLPAILDSVMTEDAFYDRLREGFEDIFLTLGLEETDNSGIPLSYEHFSKSRHWTAKTDLVKHIEDEKELKAALAKIRADNYSAILGDGMVITGICGDWECWHNTQAGTINLAETCATTYVLKMMDSLLRLNGDSIYGDVMERTIVNALFSAQSPDGRRMRYFTAFDGPRIYWTGLADIGRPPKPRQPPTTAELIRGDTFCCPNNYRRAISDLTATIYYRTSDGVAVNLYTESSATVQLNEAVKLVIKQETDYPNSGNIKLHLEPSRPCEFPLQLRIPRWCSKAEVLVNGKLAKGPVPSGAFFTLREIWKSGDQVELRLPMPWRLIKARQSQVGRVAIVRGPVVFSLSPDRHKELQGVELRLLTLDPSSLEGPFPDSTVRPNGLACKVKAWGPGAAYPDAKTDYQLVLTECPDPDGEAVYFSVPNPNAEEFVADELMGQYEHK